jgi:hypothetical protein
MKSFILLTAFVVLSVAEYSFAGVKVIGNGGDAVVCYTDATRSTIKSVQMFDYWEQEQVVKYGKIDLGDANLSVQDKIQIAVNRVAKFDPELATNINKISMSLANNINSYLVTNYILPEIEDMNPKVIPTQSNCFIEQFAIQYKDVLTGTRRFYISDKFYNSAYTSNESRAGLILHEAIYRNAILTSNVSNSDGARFFNYFIATQMLNSMNLESLEDYFKIIADVGLIPTTCKIKDGFYLKQTSVYDSGRFNFCFNQILLFGNVKVEVGPEQEILYFSDRPGFKLLSRNNGPDFKVLLVNINGFSGRYLADSGIVIDGNNIAFSSISPILGFTKPKMLGPLNKYYDCVSFDINFQKNEFSRCSFYDLNYRFNNFSNNADGTWTTRLDSYQIGTSVLRLNVLGSRKSLMIDVSSSRSYPFLYQPIIIDNQLNLISGLSRLDVPNQMPVEINGNKHFIDKFSVTQVNGNYVLNFTSAIQLFEHPRIRNLRIIDSANNDRGAGSVFCPLQGLDEGYSNLTKIEYIGIKAEQFYDVATKSIVYKTDEEVTILDRLVCLPKEFSTQNY